MKKLAIKGSLAHENKGPDFLANTGVRYFEIGGSTLKTLRQMQQDAESNDARLQQMATNLGATRIEIREPCTTLDHKIYMHMPEATPEWRAAAHIKNEHNRSQRGMRPAPLPETALHRGVWSPVIRFFDEKIPEGTWEMDVWAGDKNAGTEKEADRDALRDLINSRDWKARFCHAMAVAENTARDIEDGPFSHDIDGFDVITTADGTNYLRVAAWRDGEGDTKKGIRDHFFKPAGCIRVPTAGLLYKLTKQ